MTLDESFLVAGPDFHIDLPCIDACHPIHYIRRLLIFRCASDTQRAAQIKFLKDALPVLVAKCPLVAGVVTRPPSSREDGAAALPADWRTIIPGEGLELVIRDMRERMVSFDVLEASNFQPRYLQYENLMPIPQDITNEHPFAACKIQYTAIQGGVILTLAMSHSVSDGGGANELLRILSEATRNASVTSGSDPEWLSDGSVVGLDRSGIRDLKSDEPFNGDAHPGYTTRPKPTHQISAEEHPFTARAPEIAVLKTISAQNLAQLKEDATSPHGESWISTHDALSALIWRTVITVRSQRSSQQLPPDTPCQIYMPSDARRQLDLPPTYIGNAVYQLSASLRLGHLLASDGLIHASRAIRKAITAADYTTVKSLISESNKHWIPWSFPSTMLTTGVAMGTNWTSGLLYDQDWGPAFGEQSIRFRYPDAGFSCVLPKLKDGSAEVMIACQADEIEKLERLEWIQKYCD